MLSISVLHGYGWDGSAFCIHIPNIFVVLKILGVRKIMIMSVVVVVQYFINIMSRHWQF